jgi:hypothetical protein
MLVPWALQNLSGDESCCKGPLVFQQNALAYLLKPFTDTALLEALTAALG